jgi:hypothetical protein
MTILPLNKDLFQQWDNFAQESDDAWFWHTTNWMEYSQEYSAGNFLENRSFLITEDSEIRAICPVFIEKSFDKGTNYYQLSYSNEPMPALAIKNNLSQMAIKKILDFYLCELNKIASENKVGCISVKITPVAKSYLKEKLPSFNPFLKYGYIDLPHQTQIIDLRNSLEYLWDDIRKGHKSAIKSASKVINVNIWDSRIITSDKFSQYQLLHQKDAGRVTRSKKTFDLMYNWVKSGRAVLIEAVFDRKPIGFTLIVVYKDGAYYASSCKDPNHNDLFLSHLMQWEIIKYLKNNGLNFYDIGLQYFCNQWFRLSSEKDINISKFKKGFGGNTIRVVVSEYYFDRELMRDRFLERMNKNCGFNFKKAKA